MHITIVAKVISFCKNAIALHFFIIRQFLTFTCFNGVKGMCMAIKNTRLFYAKQFKKKSLLEKIKSNQNLKRKQECIQGDTVTISSKEKRILAKANYTLDEASINNEDSIFGNRPPKMPYIKIFSKCFSAIFCKKVSIEKAIETMNLYQKLSYIKDPKEFCQKAFEQIKNDFGYKNIDIPLVFEESGASDAAWNPVYCVMNLYTDISQKFDGLEKANIIEYLIHEFRHVRQTEMSYRTSPEKFLDAIAEDYPRRIVGDLLAQPSEAIEKMAQGTGKSIVDFQNMLRNLGLREKIDYKIFLNGKEQIFDKESARVNLDRVFGKLKPFRKGSVKYQKGLNYIEGERTYMPYNIDKDRYKNGILEKDAFKTEQQWRSIVEFTD